MQKLMRLKAFRKPAIASGEAPTPPDLACTFVTTETGPNRPMIPDSLRRRIRRLSTATLFVVAFVTAFAGTILPAAAAVVSRIDVEGNQRVDDDTVRAYVLVQPGVSFTPQDVD